MSTLFKVPLLAATESHREYLEENLIVSRGQRVFRVTRTPLVWGSCPKIILRLSLTRKGSIETESQNLSRPVAGSRGGAGRGHYDPWLSHPSSHYGSKSDYPENLQQPSRETQH